MRPIYALATDSAGCFYQRLQLPLDELVRQHPDRWAWRVGGLPNGEYPPGSVIIAQRFAGDQPGWLDLCQRDDVLCVYDLDDDLIDVDPANVVPHSIYAHQREGTIANIAAAHVVTVSTPNLARKIQPINPDVRVLPNCIADDLQRHPGAHSGELTIGWAGSMFHAQDFQPQLLADIRAVAQANPQVRWVSIGADYLSGAVGSGRHTSVGWGSIRDYHLNLSRLDIGIAPLAETEFNASKSWSKVLDYMACGVVPVAQNWGSYPDLIDVGAGFLVSESWVDALNHIIDLAPDGLAAWRNRARAESQKWTISRQVRRWYDIYAKGPQP